MTLFHIKTRKVLQQILDLESAQAEDFKEDADDTIEIIDGHLIEINKEFKVQSALRSKLNGYMAELESAKKELLASREADNRDERLKKVQDAREHLIKASSFVGELQALLTMEDKAHKFLRRGI